MKKTISILVMTALLLMMFVPVSAIIDAGPETIDKKVYDSFGEKYSANNKTTVITGDVTLKTDSKAGWYIVVTEGFVGTVEAVYKISNEYYYKFIYFDGSFNEFRIGDGSGKNGLNQVGFGEIHVCDDCPKATMALMNGVVQTMDADRSFATAVALQDNIIIYVGNDAKLIHFIDEDTEIVNLGGQMVLPGFVDSHAHPPGAHASSVPSLYYVEPTMDAYLEYMQEHINSNPTRNGYMFFHLNVSIFADYNYGFPDAAFLDLLDTGAVSKPIMVLDTAFHSWVANSEAMDRAPDVVRYMVIQGGGYAHLDPDGWPTGYFTDTPPRGLTNLIASTDAGYGTGGRTAPISYPDVATNTAMARYFAEANSYGITAVQDATGDWLRPNQEIVQRINNGNWYHLRINEPFFLDHGIMTTRYMNMNITQLINAALNNSGDSYNPALNASQTWAAQQPDWLIANTMKIYADGVTEGGSAYLLGPYAETANLYAQVADPNYRGNPMWDKERFEAVIAAVDAEGYSVHIHCLGDAAVEMAIDAIIAAQDANGTKGQVRHTLTHVPHIQASDIARMADYGIIASIQPIWAWNNPWFSPLELKMLGQERIDRVYPIKDMYEAGVIITGSADYDVTLDFRPLAGIEVGMTRTSPYSGELATLFGHQDDPKTIGANSGQTLSLMAMLEAYTINGAYQLGFDHKIGSIEVGKFADLVVLGEDLFKVAPKFISEVEVVATIVNGRIVYGEL